MENNQKNDLEKTDSVENSGIEGGKATETPSDKPQETDADESKAQKPSEEMESGKPEKEKPVKKEAQEKADSDKPVEKKKPAPKKQAEPEAPQKQYLVTSSPHIFSKDSVSKIMWTVNLCLVPAGAMAVWIFGPRILLVTLFSILGAVGSEFLWQKITKQPITIKDGSALMTGLLLAYNLPPGVPFWIPLIGSAFAIIISKQLFGGLGNNIFNPALIGRAFLLASWPVIMTTWQTPGNHDISVTSATPLNLMKQGKLAMWNLIGEGIPRSEMYWKLFVGVRGGCIGETAAFLLLLGGAYLIYKKYIDWQIPAAYIGTVAILCPVFYTLAKVNNPLNFLDTVYFSIFSGGLILGAFFMATDYVTTPSTLKGRIIFAVGCGLLTSIIRAIGGYPEGVCYSILIMNAFAPLIDAKTKSQAFGVTKEKKAA